MDSLTSEYTPSVLPFQSKANEKPVEVCRFGNISHDYSFKPHRHKFDIVVWATKGRGIQSIDCVDHEMIPGRLFFIRGGQIHQIKQYSQDGWMILLNEEALQDLNTSLLNDFYRKPYLDLKELSCETFMGLFSLLQLETRLATPNTKMITNLLNGMLLCAEQCDSFASNRSEDKFSMIKKLKSLIELEYKRNQDPDFYYQALGLPARRINNIVKPFLGKTVHELLQDRLLLESKTLLSNTNLTVKQIAAELDFNTQGYFCRFFKKMTGITALDYRMIHQAEEAFSVT